MLQRFLDIVLMDLFQHISNTEGEDKSVELGVCYTHRAVSHCTFPAERDENFSGAQEESLRFRLGWRALYPPPECQSLIHTVVLCGLPAWLEVQLVTWNLAVKSICASG